MVATLCGPARGTITNLFRISTRTAPRRGGNAVLYKSKGSMWWMEWIEKWKALQSGPSGKCWSQCMTKRCRRYQMRVQRGSPRASRTKVEAQSRGRSQKRCSWSRPQTNSTERMPLRLKYQSTGCQNIRGEQPRHRGCRIADMQSCCDSSITCGISALLRSYQLADGWRGLMTPLTSPLSTWDDRGRCQWSRGSEKGSRRSRPKYFSRSQGPAGWCCRKGLISSTYSPQKQTPQPRPFPFQIAYVVLANYSILLWLMIHQAMLTRSACSATPQVFPAASLMNPPSPQPVPHEFFTFQMPLASSPTSSTAWSSGSTAQLLKIPERYWLHLEASTQIETGCFWRAAQS